MNDANEEALPAAPASELAGEEPSAGVSPSLPSTFPGGSRRCSFARVSFHHDDDFALDMRKSHARLQADMNTVVKMLTKLNSDLEEWQAGSFPFATYASTSDVGVSKSISRVRSFRSLSLGSQECGSNLLKDQGFNEPGLVGRTDSGASLSGARDLGFIAPTLPLNWPSVLQKRSWGRATHGENYECSYFQTVASSAKRTSVMSAMGESEASSKPNGSWPTPAKGNFANGTKARCSGLPNRCRQTLRAVRDPNSSASAIVEIVGVIILLFDLVTVPYMLAWQVEYEGVISGLATVSLVYWTLDFLMAWFRGYYSDGLLILDMTSIAKRYLKTWCIMDATIVVTEWFGLLMKLAGDSESSSKLRFARLGKLLRLLSALRIIRLGRILETFTQRSISENVRLAIQVGGMSFFFMWLNHMTTCAWYTIGTVLPTDTGNHWVELSWNFDGNILHFKETPQFYQYITAFHWAMSQTTLGAMEVAPANGLERTFNIFALLMGFLFGSTLVSTLSAGMVEFQARNRDRYQKLHMLRRYMIENRVPAALALQVQRQLETRLQQRLPVTASQVTALKILSSSLQQELHTGICRPHAMTHPTFAIMACMDPAWFRKLCHICMSIQIYRPNDEIFVAGTEAATTFYSISGLCRYLQEPETSPVMDIWETEVQSKTWVCEAALWTFWTHVGTLEALDPCSLLLVNADKVGESVEQHILIRKIAREYATSYHDRVLLAKPPDSHYPDDLQVPFTDQGDLVYSMSQEAQTHIGLTAIASAPNTAGVGWDKLRSEVQTGKSVVVFNSDGQAERVVSLLIVELVKDGYSLYQIGEVENGVAHAKGPVLPGLKRLKHEDVSTALKRLIHQKLHLTEESFTVSHVEDTIQEQQSKLGVHSRYLRKLCHAEMHGSAPWGLCKCDLDLRERENHAESVETTMSLAVGGAASGQRLDLLQNLQVWFVELAENGDEAPETGIFYCWLLPHDADRIASLGETCITCYLQSLTIPWTKDPVADSASESSQPSISI